MATIAGTDSAVQAYFDAWNRRGPAAIVATFVEGGTYSDPAAGGWRSPAWT